MKKTSNLTLLFIAQILLICRFASLKLTNIIIIILLAIVFYRSEYKKSKSMIAALVLGIIGLAISFTIIVFISSTSLFSLIDLITKIANNKDNNTSLYIEDLRLLGDTLRKYTIFISISELVSFSALGSAISIMSYKEAKDKKYQKKQLILFIIALILLVVTLLFGLIGINNTIYALTHCITDNKDNIFTAEFNLYGLIGTIFTFMAILPGIAYFILLVFEAIAIKKCDIKIVNIES